jgi:CDP-glucose 4,6-dehydratase
MFDNQYSNRRVLVTGHTGFKGSWLCQWLLDLGAHVIGFSLPPEPESILFQHLELEKRIDHYIGDIRDKKRINQVVLATKPEIIFHLAAQPLVRRSYREPSITWETNVIGSLNLFEAIKAATSVSVCVVITTDKCYENLEWDRGYRESDRLGGHDPYSASKAACEILSTSYRKSFFNSTSSPILNTVRAGNVIGGGDRSEDRLVVDFIKSIRSGTPLILRNPTAVRPWQHVLEPLSGYLWLAISLLKKKQNNLAYSWNFGPEPDSCISVRDLANLLVKAWGSGSIQEQPDVDRLHESGLLRLDCSLAKQYLGWRGVWSPEIAIRKIVEWELQSTSNEKMKDITSKQIIAYHKSAMEQNISWSNEMGIVHER